MQEQIRKAHAAQLRTNYEAFDTALDDYARRVAELVGVPELAENPAWCHGVTKAVLFAVVGSNSYASEYLVDHLRLSSGFAL